jgi:hypothetical protein
VARETRPGAPRPQFPVDNREKSLLIKKNAYGGNPGILLLDKKYI